MTATWCLAPISGVQFVNGVSTAMSAGAAAYSGSVETMQLIGGDVQQQQQQKPVQQLQTTQQQSATSPAGPPVAIQLADGTTLVPTESLISPPQHLSAAHLPQMATIVTAAGANPILVPSSQPGGPIAVAIGPQVIDYSHLNGGGGGSAQGEVVPVISTGGGVDGCAGAAAVVPAGEYYIQTTAGPEVMHGVVPHEQLIMAPVAGSGPVTATSDGTPIPFDQLKALLQTQLEYYFSR